ncbi:hypothetical protein [Streptomyces sp. NBC_01306]|uniref:hypothetical protein n=1 Tax=Streptomyces sp. NBC_01306 TaxID=2903819 RepID=UPI0022562A9A|nr:hypothetical protein [Streptomyces sp. NBC_01306]MCX4725983.1 hypothetical protein [Streptomyces sp. NBC_01306]
MITHNELRLLPWSGPEGKPCYLSTDDANGYLSRLADSTEAVQLGLAAELLEASDVLGDRDAGLKELRVLAGDLTGALRDVLRVAISRGHRLSAPEFGDGEEDGEGPRLPAAAFG